MAPHTGQPRSARASAARWHMAHSIIDTQNTPSQRVRRRGRPGNWEDPPGACSVSMLRGGAFYAQWHFLSTLYADNEVAAFVNGKLHRGALAGVEGVDHAHRRRGREMPCGGQGGGQGGGHAGPQPQGRGGGSRKAWAGGSRSLSGQRGAYVRPVRPARARPGKRAVCYAWGTSFLDAWRRKIEDRCRSCSYYAVRRALVSARAGIL